MVHPLFVLRSSSQVLAQKKPQCETMSCRVMQHGIIDASFLDVQVHSVQWRKTSIAGHGHVFNASTLSIYIPSMGYPRPNIERRTWNRYFLTKLCFFLQYLCFVGMDLSRP